MGDRFPSKESYHGYLPTTVESSQ